MITVVLPLPPRNQLEQRYAEHQDSYDKLLHELQRRIRTALTAQDLRATIKYRVKTFNSYYQKLIRIARENRHDEGVAVSSATVTVTDVIGVRIVCPFLEDVAAAERVLREAFEIYDLDRKGAKFTVREFGYQSTHCLLRVPQDLCESFHLGGPLDCEVQLRTILQDAWAEVEHELVYKSDFSPFDDSIRRKLAALNANLSLSDITFQEIREYQRRLNAELRRRRVKFWDSLNQTVGRADAVNGNIPLLDSTFQSEPADLGVSDQLGPGTSPAAWASGGNLDSDLLAALQAHNAGDYAEAKRIYTHILEVDPEPFVKAIVFIHRGMAGFSEGSYRAALDDFGAALEIDDTNCRAHFYRGTVYRVLGDVERADAEFERCLEIDPYRIDCLYQRSAMRLQHGDLAGARADCAAALELEPDSEMLARLLAAIGEREAYGDANGAAHGSADDQPHGDQNE